jgi:DNA-directed RNA polymerase subunit RPC12/RpoP
MPIRFRCVYCNQLMGIARRKAGMVVRCPNCTGQIIVPRPESGAEDDEPAESKPAQTDRPPFFEQVDIDEALAGGGKRAAAPLDPESAAHPIPIAPSYEEPAEPTAVVRQFDFPSGLPSPGAPTGIFLSPTRATILSVIFVIALAIAFAAGLFVGRSLHTPAATEGGPVTAPI